MFIAHLATFPSLNSYSSFSGSIDGVKFHLSQQNISVDSFYSDSFLKRMVGLRKTLGKVNAASKEAKALTVQSCTPMLLQELDQHFRVNTMTQRNCKRAAIVAAVSAFRLGELAKTKHNKGVVPRYEHWKCTSSQNTLHLPFSKADKFHKGVTRNIPSTHEPISAAAALRDCELECHRSRIPTKPLFCNEQGEAISVDEIMIELKWALQKAGYSTAGFTTKCFRRGGASEMKANGGSKKEIQKLGNWKSDAFKFYIDPKVIANRNYPMASDNSDHEFSDSDDELITKKGKFTSTYTGRKRKP